jgi:hypothetical protein
MPIFRKKILSKLEHNKLLEYVESWKQYNYTIKSYNLEIISYNQWPKCHTQIKN